MAMTDVNLDRIECRCYEQGMKMAEFYIGFRQRNYHNNFTLNSFSTMLNHEHAECRAGFFDTLDAYIAEYVAIHTPTSNQV